MAAPTTTAALYDLVRKSGLVEPARLEAHQKGLTQSGRLPEKVVHLARRLVEDGLITHFQAEQFLRGRYKGFTLGNYRILERLGQGGMGMVYLAEHQVMRHRVAIKVLPPDQAELPTVVERFHREARAAAVLQHPNIVRAYDIGQEGAMHFLVMEYVEGVNLQELVSRRGRLSIERAAHYIAQAAIGLQYAHESAGLVHRDIKPGNLLVDRCGTVKILDMGLARFFHDKTDVLTQKFNDKNILGTADYLAPEQAINSSAADIRADLYSLGCTFFFLLTGETPIPKGTITQKLMWHQTTPIRSIRTLRPDVPEELDAILLRLFRKDPAERFAVPVELVEALQPWLNQPVEPPEIDEIPVLCRAAQGPTSSASLSATSLSTAVVSVVRASRPSSHSSLELGELPNGGSSCSLSRHSQRSLSSGNSRVDTPRASQPLTVDQLQPSLRARRPVLLAAAMLTVGMLVCGGFGVHALMGDHTAAATQPQVTTPDQTVLRISLKDRTNNTPRPFATVAAALQQAKPGDRIVVQGELLRENLTWTKAGVALEGRNSEGKHVRWQPQDGSAPLLSIQQGTDVSVSGFDLDGAGQVEDLIVVSGPCAGLCLEDLDCTRFRRSGILVQESRGTPENCARLRQLRLASPMSESAPRAGLLFETGTGRAAHFRIVDCRIEGPALAAVEVAGSLVDVEFQHNRFVDVTYGLHYRKMAEPTSLDVSFQGNTFSQMQHIAYFETLPRDRLSRVQLNHNLAAKISKELGFVQDAPAQAPFSWTAGKNVLDR